MLFNGYIFRNIALNEILLKIEIESQSRFLHFLLQLVFNYHAKKCRLTLAPIFRRCLDLGDPQEIYETNYGVQ